MLGGDSFKDVASRTKESSIYIKNRSVFAKLFKNIHKKCAPVY